MNQPYEQLTSVLDPDKVAGWELDTLRAEADRGKALDIYLLKEDKAPTFHEVWLWLMKKPKSASGNVGLVDWLAEGIGIEDSQDQLRSEIQQLPNPLSTRQEVKISEKRQRLSSRIESSITMDDPAFCGTDEEHGDREFWDDDDEGDWEAPEEEVEGLASELMSIWMLSSIGAAKLTELHLHDLLKEGRELRIGQANDSANSTKEGTRTKKEIQKVVARVNKHVRSYQRTREAILRLDSDANMAERYQEILPGDLVVSKEVTKENKFGQGTSKLAQFWVMDGGKIQLNVQAGGLMEEFYRINWLKARARRDRWKEVSLEVEEDDPLVSHLHFLLDSDFGIRRAEDMMDIVGLIVSRLEESLADMKEPREGGEGAGMGEGDREDEEKEEEEAPAVLLPFLDWSCGYAPSALPSSSSLAVLLFPSLLAAGQYSITGPLDSICGDPSLIDH
ncbi:hypothetical protein EV401DRAFT_2077609 [Pisolithus croceorrhizus]|nr:hypothetical protein EV401DRAFT_2077609 [Pisolithus croceorrhizus]